MNVKNFSASFLALILINLSTQAAEPIDKVIAQVEKGVILKSELDRKIKQAKKQIISRGGQVPAQKVLEKELLEQLIVQSIQLQMAQRAGIQVPNNELQYFAKQIASQSSASLPEFRLQLAQDGTPYEIFLNDLENEILTTRIREGMVKRRVKISEKEIESLIQTIDADKNIEYNLGHILVSVPEYASKKEVEEYKQEALKLKERLDAGAIFANIAIAESDGREATSGGDFGWKTENDMPTLFADIVYHMRKGEISTLIKSPSGFHILKLLDKRGEEQHMVRQVNARHILITPDAITNSQAAQSLLVKLRSKILSGDKDFSNLAKQHSKDPGSANIGGDLGWQSPKVYDPVFKDELEKLRLNEISQPFKSSFGWHIVQLLGERQSDQTQEMKKKQAAQVLQKRKFAEEVENWLREIRDEAYVKKIVEEDS